MLRHLKIKTSADEMSLKSRSVSLDGVGHQGSADVNVPSKIVLNTTNTSLASSISLSSSEENALLIKPPSSTHPFADTSHVKSSKHLQTLSSSTNRKKRKSPPSEQTIPSTISFTSSIDEVVVVVPIAKKLKSTCSTSTTCTVVPKENVSNSILNSVCTMSEPDDIKNLNPLHCFVRRNIEYFVANVKDVHSPCPGRKSAIRIGQVGLRCIHCRDVTDRRERTKRAVCYPSKVSRIYHCVSDMKFDHFSQCKFLPKEEREIFDELKAESSNKKRGPNSRGGSNTAQHYLASAMKQGLVDSSDGVVVFSNQAVSSVLNSDPTNIPVARPAPERTSIRAVRPVSEETTSTQPTYTSNTLHIMQQCPPLPFAPISPRPDQHVTPLPTVSPSKPDHDEGSSDSIQPYYDPSIVSHTCRPLATPSDVSSLNPIHCFVRQNVEVFIANEDDVKAPAPGRKTRVSLGQVGMRCIHCKNLAPKERVKRAICYPPTVSNLYHAISNMKFDHYGACKGLPPAERERFNELRASVSNSGGRKRGGNKSTAGYYKESALKDLGLFDTDAGIRVKNNSFVSAVPTLTIPSRLSSPPTPPLPLLPPPPLTNPLILRSKETTSTTYTNTVQPALQNVPSPSQSPTMDGMSALMIAATDPAVQQDYENRKMAASFAAGYRHEFTRQQCI